MWLAIVTTTAAWQKIFARYAHRLLGRSGSLGGKTGGWHARSEHAAVAPQLIFNQRLDAVLAVLLTLILWVVIADMLRVAWRVTHGLPVLPDSEASAEFVEARDETPDQGVLEFPANAGDR